MSSSSSFHHANDPLPTRMLQTTEKAVVTMKRKLRQWKAPAVMVILAPPGYLGISFYSGFLLQGEYL